MISPNDIFFKKTNDALSAIDESVGAVNVLNVCSDYYDFWNAELIPKLRRHKIAVYPFLVNMFHEVGCAKVNEKMLQSYFCKIKKRRTMSGSGGAMLVGEVRPSPHIATTVAVLPKPGVTPIIPPSVTPAVVAPPLRAPLAEGEEAYPHVYAKVSLTPLVDYEDFGKDLESLQVQSRSGWLDWSGTDEGYWLGFLTKIETYNKTYEPKWAVKANQVDFWKYLQDIDDIAMFKLLLRKAVEKRNI